MILTIILVAGVNVAMILIKAADDHKQKQRAKQAHERYKAQCHAKTSH
ncbi:hypothetical protein J3L18_05475 [Mucilaginibacter gossypii]|nr:MULTISPECIES: hypothetical protein [Mucilaginibacter]QTE38529.1 hypothetical protein J3L18_05475 [Mucilaginibacter gossypii]